MDAKVASADAPPTLISRWLASARSMTSRLLSRRPPFEDGLKLNGIFARSIEKQETPMVEAVGPLTKAS
jgi:hypothetical protein